MVNTAMIVGLLRVLYRNLNQSLVLIVFKQAGTHGQSDICLGRTYGPQMSHNERCLAKLGRGIAYMFYIV